MENNIQLTRPGLAPLDFYHNVWTRVRKCFFDQVTAAKLDDWEHSCDDEIRITGDAVPSIRRMLAVLEDSYTCLADPKPEDATDPDQPEPLIETSTIGGSIAYVRVPSFGSNRVFREFEEAVRGLGDVAAYIIDLRGNTGGFLLNSCRVAALFLADGLIQTYRNRDFDDGYFEASLKLTPEGFEESTTYESGKTDFETWGRFECIDKDKPVVLLINGGTASTSELFAATLQDHKRATVIGTESYGKGIGQSEHMLENGYVLQLTDSHFLPPSGQFFGNAHQGVRNPIVPDILVELDEHTEGDAQLAAAIQACSNRMTAAAR